MLYGVCVCVCGYSGQMTRSRLVLHQAGEGGRPCPSQLSQTKPCPIRSCYSWILGDWNSCRVEVSVQFLLYSLHTHTHSQEFALCCKRATVVTNVNTNSTPIPLHCSQTTLTGHFNKNS